MKHKLPIIIGVAMIVVLAALTGGGVWTQTGVGVASITTPEAVPERRISLPNLKGKMAQGKGPPVSGLQVSDELMIAEINSDDEDSMTDGIGTNAMGRMQSPVEITNSFIHHGMIVAPAG